MPFGSGKVPAIDVAVVNAGSRTRGGANRARLSSEVPLSTPTGSARPGGRRRPRPPLPTGTKVLLGVLLLVPIVVPLLVPLYARETPALIGIPFFFWFQFVLIPVTAVMTSLAFLVTSRHERAGGVR